MKDARLPRITFGIIVLNGEPFTRYNLRALYPFAHQIIVVEGAAPAAAKIATPDGHSTDGTLDILRDFKENEDPENKVTIITAEDEGYPTGFWPGEKHEQSQAYACRATGDYLWQIDSDEFYQPEEMRVVLKMLQDDPEITFVSFKMVTFWGGLDYINDGWYLRHQAALIHRIFKWGPGYRYASHRPPTVYNDQGRDIRQIKWLKRPKWGQRDIFMYHYSLIFPKQVLEKSDYYGAADWTVRRDESQKWAEAVFLKLQNPYRVHNVYRYPSWLERFKGKHPPVIEMLRTDLESGYLNITLRQTDDIEQLLVSPWYRLGCWCLKILFVPWLLWRRGAKKIKNPFASSPEKAATL